VRALTTDGLVGRVKALKGFSAPLCVLALRPRPSKGKAEEGRGGGGGGGGSECDDNSARVCGGDSKG